MSHPQDYEGARAEYRFDFVEREERPKFSQRKAPSHAQRGNRSPQSFNGMHRRRRRKMAW